MLALSVLLVTGVLMVIGAVRGGADSAQSEVSAATSTGLPSPVGRQPAASRGGAAGRTTLTAPATVAYPQHGPETFAIAPGSSPVLGRAGTLLRFRVAVENGISGLDPAQFGATVTGVLGSAASWIGTNKWRFQRVGPAMRYDFTLYLATPGTRDTLCADGHDGYTSCRNGDKVVLNVARWAHGVPAYGASLQAYRTYAINHEVGHRLGQLHERCPAAGQLAPVMQQQSLGLHGCQPNSWPLVAGKTYAGPIGAYNDPIPPAN